MLAGNEKWDTTVPYSSSSSNTNSYKEFCAASKFSSSLINDNKNGVVVGDNSFDLNRRIGRIEWTRPFDVDSDNSMTLVANEKFKIWMMWGLFFNERSSY